MDCSKKSTVATDLGVPGLVLCVAREESCQTAPVLRVSGEV